MKNRFLILWILWTLLGAFLIYGVSVSDTGNTLASIIANVISISPLIGIILALGSVKASGQFNYWLQREEKSLLYLAGGISLLFIIPGLLTGEFNPYYSIIFVCIVFAVFGTLRQVQNKEFTLTWTDLLLWIVIWIPFDLRWYMDILPAASESYIWWSVAVSVIGIVGWNGYRRAGIGFNLVPKLKDFRIVLLALVMIFVLVTPPGLLTGFLTFSFPDTYDIPKLLVHFAGLFLTVALPEELFFRGILLGGLEKMFSKKWIPLAISSLAFGLMHWNNIEPLSMQIIYVVLATIAGVGYGWAYRKSGNNLFAAILVHTLVDWIWKLYLSG